MYKMDTNRKFNWGYLIVGIMFIIVSLIAFRDPASSLIAIVMVFGVAAIVKGLFELFYRYKLKEFTGNKATSLIVIGVLDIIVGILLLFNLGVSVSMLPYFFAVWFIVDSIGDISLASVYKAVSPAYYWFMVIINILGVILGIMLLFNPLTSALTLAYLVGFYFMMTGIMYIVAAF